ncbi:MAG: excinuclease ABC subunit UvrB [Myxococcota bacterium]
MTTRRFEICSEYEPAGDQPSAISALVEGVEAGLAKQVLLGATGTGKTYTIAKLIEAVQRPALVLAPNKTLAAQLFTEFQRFFPDNAVSYFVSYYDYYQPEAYVPSTDTFIEKDAMINDTIDQMRHAATRSVIARPDTLIIASVSCIYGIGHRSMYEGMLIHLDQGTTVRRDRLLRALVDAQYQRNDFDFHRSTFRVRGDVVEVFPVYEDDEAIRLTFWGDELESIQRIDPLRGTVRSTLTEVDIFPGSHYVTPSDQLRKAIVSIQDELQGRLQELRGEGHLVEAQRLEQRTMYDIEMLEQMGFCHGIENYSRHLTGAAPGEPPPVLLDYFADDFLMVIDESHVALPQVGGMFRGDQARKGTLVDHGFRLPSAMDNRPLRFEEFEERVGQVVYMSATPGEYELEAADGAVIELINRPTGLIDPQVEIRPVATQVDDLLEAIRERVAKGQRVLVTTLTKRMSEDLTEYYRELGVQVRYLHSDIDTLERVQLLADLRRGVFDVLVGINLLREGLDLPEVGLVAILDADKEGFLRSARSLIQTIGRAARHLEGSVILYADRITRSMKQAIDETERRRGIQLAFNAEHGITPRSVIRSDAGVMHQHTADVATAPVQQLAEAQSPAQLNEEIARLRLEMTAAAKALEFERAAELRDQLRAYEAAHLGLATG